MAATTSFRVSLTIVIALTRPATGSAQAPLCGEVSSQALFVFVGRKVEVRQVGNAVPPGQPFILDNRFEAMYDVLHVVCGFYSSARIAFDVYDHYGMPAFAEYDTVLLYVSRRNGRLVHEKYLFSPVYLTVEGDWFGCGDPYAMDEPHPGSVRARPVRFRNEVSFPMAGLSDSVIMARFPSQFFERRGGKAVCVAGASVADLFTIKRDGFLKARGIFP